MDKEFKQKTPEETTVLIVGDGDFSFSVAFITRYHPIHLTATTLELDKLMLTKYPNFSTNVSYLQGKGVNVCTGVDATQLHLIFKNQHFSHIIFNFPHVGGKSNIKKNRELLDKFFQSASHHISESGAVLVTLCQGQGGTGADQPRREWCNSWQITAKAANSGLILTSVDKFEGKHLFDDYLSTGFRSQNKRFHTEGSLVHKFTKSLVCPLPRSVGSCPLIWKTDENLVQKFTDSITLSWDVVLAISQENFDTFVDYSNFYCLRQFTFSVPPHGCQTVISYGSKFTLYRQRSDIVLQEGEDNYHIVGSLTSDKLLVSARDVLTVLFNIKDCRYFSNAHLQLGTLTRLTSCTYDIEVGQLASIYPPEYRFDISFWIPEQYKTTQFLSLVHKISNHIVREVTLVDRYVEADTGRASHCYSLIYQCLNSALSYSQAYVYYQHLRQTSADILNVTLR